MQRIIHAWCIMYKETCGGSIEDSWYTDRIETFTKETEFTSRLSEIQDNYLNEDIVVYSGDMFRISKQYRTSICF